MRVVCATTWTTLTTRIVVNNRLLGFAQSTIFECCAFCAVCAVCAVYSLACVNSLFYLNNMPVGAAVSTILRLHAIVSDQYN